MNLNEIIKIAEKHDACGPVLDKVEDYNTLEEAMQDEKAPYWAYWLRLKVCDLPDNIKRMAEQKACEESLWAYYLRRFVTDLPEEVKRQAEQKACEAPKWAYLLRGVVADLRPETVDKLKEMDL